MNYLLELPTWTVCLASIFEPPDRVNCLSCRFDLDLWAKVNFRTTYLSCLFVMDLWARYLLELLPVPELSAWPGLMSNLLEQTYLSFHYVLQVAVSAGTHLDKHHSQSYAPGHSIVSSYPTYRTYPYFSRYLHFYEYTVLYTKSIIFLPFFFLCPVCAILCIEFLELLCHVRFYTICIFTN